MQKTLLRKFTGNTQIPANVMDMDVSTETLTDLMQELRSALKGAATDLLQPRPEAIAQLLQKAKLAR